MSGTLWIALGGLAVAAGVAVRWRIRKVRRREDGEVDLDDDAMRQIEKIGRLETDEREPLDHDHIREEEDRFWAETWDEPDEPFFG